MLQRIQIDFSSAQSFNSFGNAFEQRLGPLSGTGALRVGANEEKQLMKTNDGFRLANFILSEQS